MRNEEECIITTLDAIAQQTYDKTIEVELLIGDDASTDTSFRLVEQWVKQQNINVRLLSILPSTLPGLKGKTNVLDQLIKASNPDSTAVKSGLKSIVQTPQFFSNLKDIKALLP